MKKTMILGSKEVKHLDTLGASKIIIKKISSDSNINSLACPIEVTIDKPEVVKKWTIIATSYFSNENPGIVTDKEMNEIITSCEYATLKVNNIFNVEQFNFKIEYEEMPDLIDRLVIYVNNQTEGRTYSLHPNSKKEIVQKFPNAKPAGQLYTSYENEQAFQLQHGDILKPFIQGITNLKDSELLRLGSVDFIDSHTNTLLISKSFDI